MQTQTFTSDVRQDGSVIISGTRANGDGMQIIIDSMAEIAELQKHLNWCEVEIGFRTYRDEQGVFRRAATQEEAERKRLGMTKEEYDRAFPAYPRLVKTDS